MNLTESELDTLRHCTSAAEWQETMDQIKSIRSGENPPDFWEKVIHSGLYNSVTSQFVNINEEVQLEIISL